MEQAKKTIKIILNQAAPNDRTELRINGLTFRYDKKLRPIPVEVPVEIATVLLQMQGRTHSCCPHADIEPLFLEVS